ncbi:putative white collar 1 protein [Podospora australis]|uniref:White collar 1 protein n=1 Tax=Podospora australis TaxID=1536484 RepID=A0AAN6WXA9_9PEZI|nr:putative white collar 1 protein [Podospora australis]
MNNNMYSSTMSSEEAQRRVQQQNPGRNLGMINTAHSGAVSHGDPLSAMSGMPMSARSIDEMVRQNNHELNRRQSVHQPYTNAMLQDEADRGMSSMMDFGNAESAYQDFQFANMNSPQNGGFGGVSMPGSSGPFSQSNLLAMSEAQPNFTTLSPDMMGNMMAFSNLNVGLGGDHSLSLFNSPNMNHQYPPSTLDAVSPDFAMDMTIGNTPMSATSVTRTMVNDDMSGMEDVYSGRTQQRPPNLTMDPNMDQLQRNMPPSLSREMSGTTAFRSPTSGTSGTISQMSVAQSGATPGASSSTPMTPGNTPIGPAPPPENAQGPKQEKTIYSKSGFDMLRALWYVATRKNPQLQIGAVDMSCAFVVCDVTLNDCPIIYVSDNFQNLTGYFRSDILGQNCRFLQSPDGAVEAGTKREFVENDAVFKLKDAIAQRREIQQSLINYRKGGKPFLNLLTMIPIPWDDPTEIRYYIGFQIDLVECPDAISGQEAGGAMQVNYVKSEMNQYIWQPPSSTHWEPDNGQTLAKDDVSTLLKQFTPQGVVSDWHRQSWDKMLLENADDVVHVLSLKGVFMYVSPSCKKILEYDASELTGHLLSRFCHPSDIVPVTRELKEAQANVPVNVVLRFRRKHGGYTWFESHGTLFSEQGKGRKSIIFIGRKRPIYTLRRSDLEANGGIGDSEIWSKVTTSGMFLFVQSNVRSLLDLQREDLEGTSMQDLMRKESRADFGRAIEKARKGKIASCKHEVHNKRGQVLQAYTTFFPGDAEEGGKPTFLLAQTRLLKASSNRAIAPAGSKLTAASVSDDGGHSIGGVVMGHMHNMDTDGSLISPGALALNGVDDNIFDELKGTRCTSWQYELRQMERVNRNLAEELAQLLSNKKKRKRRKGGGIVRDCANCHTRNTPEWRRGPSGQRDLCNSCGLRWAKQTGRVSPRNSSRGNGDTHSKKSNSPSHASPLHREHPATTTAAATTTNTVTADTPPRDSASRSPTVTTTPSNSISPGEVGQTDTSTPTGGQAASAKGGIGPPQSQPMLEGGSGFRGGGMEMTSIREERESGV